MTESPHGPGQVQTSPYPPDQIIVWIGLIELELVKQLRPTLLRRSITISPARIGTNTYTQSDAGRSHVKRVATTAMILWGMIEANTTWSSSRICVPTVLVVEDDAMVRRTLEILLEDHGFRVVTGVDGVEGLEKFHQVGPDVVLTDIIMPNKEGIALSIELRRENPGARIIAMSGGGRMGNSDYVTIATKLGADIGLRKPFDDEQLINTVRTLLNHPPVSVPAAA